MNQWRKWMSLQEFQGEAKNLHESSKDYHKIVYCGAENCIVSNICQEIFETHPFHTSTQHSTRSKPFQGTNSGSKVEPSWPLKSCKSFTWSSNVWCHGVHFGSSSNCKSCNYFDLKVRFYEKRSNDIQKESSWEQIGDWSLGIWSPATRYSMDLAILFYAWNTTMQFWLKKGHQNGQIPKAIVITMVQTLWKWSLQYHKLAQSAQGSVVPNEK